MLIGLCGGTCSGKHAVVEYLVRRHDFSILELIGDGKDQDGREAGEGRPKSAQASHQFSSADELLDFATKDWQQGWVTTSIWDQDILECLTKRPWFLLVNVDAPLSLRLARYKRRCENLGKPVPTLEDFVADNDKQLYHPQLGLASLMGHADIHLINSSDSLLTLHTGLDKLNLTNEERLRPSWDQYFMQLASLAARRSNCMKRRVGCVIVREKRVISTGYNGTPRNLKNCNEGGCSRCNGGQGSGASLSTCLCLHAEENALLEAGRERIREGSTLYCNTCPCLTCSIKITQVGISEVVYSQSYSMDRETATVFAEAGISFRQFVEPRKRLVSV